ncbi:MAG: YajQ family cyclic di-GMP-binding protein [candidate division Zixibacteria bacterium]|nr:YajQ family cyclic di-GMP-binding protein [candidate division Zixibacteria bacterium]
MAQSFSFDIVSKVDMSEVLNAVNQVTKEIQTRYDFKGSKSSITLNQEENHMIALADDEFKLRSVVDILQDKLIKRSVSLKAMTYKTVEEATQGMARQRIDIQSGIEKEKAKEIVKYIKETKIRVQAAIQDAQVRVSGQKKDDLQTIIAKLKEHDFGIHMQYVNFR